MRGVVDESTGPSVALWLTSLGHDVVSIYDELPRLPDEDILAFAARDVRIVITNDKDFGELVFRDRRPHRGVILLRLANEHWTNKIAALERLLGELPEDLHECFVVVTEDSIRVTRHYDRGRE